MYFNEDWHTLVTKYSTFCRFRIILKAQHKSFYKPLTANLKLKVRIRLKLSKLKDIHRVDICSPSRCPSNKDERSGRWWCVIMWPLVQDSISRTRFQSQTLICIRMRTLFPLATVSTSTQTRPTTSSQYYRINISINYLLSFICLHLQTFYDVSSFFIVGFLPRICSHV